jgi:hypothetical protein
MEGKTFIVMLTVLGVFLLSCCVEEEASKEKACIDSGGRVSAGMCCGSVDDFPNLCTVGACGCSPDSSHEVKVCECGEGRCFNGSVCVSSVNSFEDCVKAGYPIMESYPPQCRTPDGRTFTVKLEYCISSSGAVMGLDEARQIALESECGDRLKDSCMCNNYTGTWWIDLDIQLEGCNPACVVDVETGEAVINWRCTGLII